MNNLPSLSICLREFIIGMEGLLLSFQVMVYFNAVACV
jgi:hypothetical protein